MVHIYTRFVDTSLRNTIGSMGMHFTSWFFVHLRARRTENPNSHPAVVQHDFQSVVVLFAGAGCRGGGRGGLVWVSDDSSLIFISNGVHFGLFLLNLFFAMSTLHSVLATLFLLLLLFCCFLLLLLLPWVHFGLCWLHAFCAMSTFWPIFATRFLCREYILTYICYTLSLPWVNFDLYLLQAFFAMSTFWPIFATRFLCHEYILTYICYTHSLPWVHFLKVAVHCIVKKLILFLLFIPFFFYFRSFRLS